MTIQEEIKAKRDQIAQLKEEIDALKERDKECQGARYQFSDKGINVSVHCKNKYFDSKRSWRNIAVGRTKRELVKELTYIIKSLNSLLNLIEADENIPNNMFQENASEPAVITMMKEIANNP